MDRLCLYTSHTMRSYMVTAIEVIDESHHSPDVEQQAEHVLANTF